MLKTQDLEIARQAVINNRLETTLVRQGEVISRLEKALMTSDWKSKQEVQEYKPEVLETGKNIFCLTVKLYFIFNICIKCRLCLTARPDNLYCLSQAQSKTRP